ncbi:bifunctional inhibitor/lipid-transfer protein/seed storage 2S albumin superfamily protein [Artemisia annua]|uniref:Bifunctional inhibitor/lipid-transfer protein/seed storage 2S albumin superfamily protein n=1 Tax=Artemisia annua TaxID=35608 RepID=A0A2U1QKP8_ARTAN|nr:bifunctional inhibitor/lipid-transfer protein/seed storage 2S albumin superfamily protein [Artemisia annua]
MATSPQLTALVTLLLVAMTASTARAQAQTCASKLVPCANYLNATTKPPNSCCDPIKEAVATDLQCLCNLYENPSFLSSLGINVTQALNLPKLCGISSDDSACKTGAQAPSGSSTDQPPPGSTPGGNGVGRLASSGVIGLFLVSACMMLS